MNAGPARGRWDRVEFYTSYFLLAVLASVIATRLGFADVWALPRVDFVLSAAALALVLASFWVARARRGLRLGTVAFAAATQLVPVSIRHPAVLLALAGALVPVLVALWALVALSRKAPDRHRTPGA
ncbi:LrgA [Fulvimonas sp. R45]|uniref:LrgA n=1 Tax=Fulvimonas sp. R45 TaxID=3045937 RepID=UPI00265D913D|nr:LrgA [Fulvimonas sp. R45]MDO1529781.1 LrgA [Fulvimonas sp. R45]